MYDIIVVGAGPAGLTSAIYACRNGRSVLVLEKESFGGLITHSPRVENYPGYRELSGAELGEKLVDQACDLGANVEFDNVLKVEKENGIFKVTGEMHSYEGKTLILATGSKHRKLGLPREDEFEGNGLSYCAVCDGPFYSGKDVAIIGGGNSALQEAVLLSGFAKSVTIVQNLAFLTGEKNLMEILNNKDNVKVLYNKGVTSLNGEGHLQSIDLVDSVTNEKSNLVIDGVFVAIGQQPENEPFTNLVDLDKWGYFASDESCVSKTEGVFVAGDARSKKIRQVVTASADGATCAINACRYLDSLN